MEWISINDKLPDENQRVIVYRQNEPEQSVYRCTVMWGWGLKVGLKHGGITHWMPLPEPPKEESIDKKDSE